MKVCVHSFIVDSMPVLTYLRMSLHTLIILLNFIQMISLKLCNDVPVQQLYITLRAVFNVEHQALIYVMSVQCVTFSSQAELVESLLKNSSIVLIIKPWTERISHGGQSALAGQFYLVGAPFTDI